MAHHVISFAELGGTGPEVRYRFVCSCGARGIPTPHRPIAEYQAERHLLYVREVAAIKEAGR